MHTLVHSGMLFLEGIFIIGWVGAIVVVVISGVEDLKTVFSKADSPETHQPIES